MPSIQTGDRKGGAGRPNPLMIHGRGRKTAIGSIRGPGGPTDDMVNAHLSNGEYTLPADTVQAVGKDKLDALIASTHQPTGRTPAIGQLADGGMRRPVLGYADGGMLDQQNAAANPNAMSVPGANPNAMGANNANPNAMGATTSNPNAMGATSSNPNAMGADVAAGKAFAEKGTAFQQQTPSIGRMNKPSFTSPAITINYSDDWLPRRNPVPQFADGGEFDPQKTQQQNTDNTGAGPKIASLLANYGTPIQAAAPVAKAIAGGVAEPFAVAGDKARSFAAGAIGQTLQDPNALQNAALKLRDSGVDQIAGALKTTAPAIASVVGARPRTQAEQATYDAQQRASAAPTPAQSSAATPAPVPATAKPAEAAVTTRSDGSFETRGPNGERAFTDNSGGKLPFTRGGGNITTVGSDYFTQPTSNFNAPGSALAAVNRQTNQQATPAIARDPGYYDYGGNFHDTGGLGTGDHRGEPVLHVGTPGGSFGWDVIDNAKGASRIGQMKDAAAEKARTGFGRTSAEIASGVESLAHAEQEPNLANARMLEAQAAADPALRQARIGQLGAESELARAQIGRAGAETAEGYAKADTAGVENQAIRQKMTAFQDVLKNPNDEKVKDRYLTLLGKDKDDYIMHVVGGGVDEVTGQARPQMLAILNKRTGTHELVGGPTATSNAQKAGSRVTGADGRKGTVDESGGIKWDKK